MSLEQVRTQFVPAMNCGRKTHLSHGEDVEVIVSLIGSAQRSHTTHGYGVLPTQGRVGTYWHGKDKLSTSLLQGHGGWRTSWERFHHTPSTNMSN